jgi:hypothetical protein
MSSLPPTTSAPVHPPAPPDDTPREITIISHSNLFYWWSVWAVGFLMGFLTLISGYIMAIVPDDGASVPEARRDWTVRLHDAQGKEKDEKLQGILIKKRSDKRDATPLPSDQLNQDEAEKPHLRVADSKTYGVIFCFWLLMVIVITNVPLRGMWSVTVILLVVLLSVIFALADWWGPILRMLGALDIRMNAGFYFFVASVLFIVWILTFVFFDRQTYMSFTPGQLRVCTEVGGGEKVYDASGMTLEKQRSDLFRHWILGLGSGDLIVRTSGAQAHQFDLPNVLFIGRKVAEIEEMLKKKSVIESR